MATPTAPVLRKPAEAAHPIHALIGERWSPRAFADRPVAQGTLHSLLEAARWAASTANQQPWSFVVATREDAAAHARMVGTLMELNVRWAQHAPVLLLVAAKLYEWPGKEHTSFYDVGLAVGNLVTQAMHLGLVTHQMGGFYADTAREVLRIPAGYEPLAVVALGYPGDHEALPEDLREREVAPRSRKAQREFVFAGRSGDPLVATS
jgi:nitroreductase